jgi:Raf kinase inhibitor-like YbhB/YbcL family protein
MTFALSSPAFADHSLIPARYARDGENISPFLQWDDPPRGTQSYALILEDIDAPRTREPGEMASPFRHWAVFDIPPRHRHLAEGLSSKGGTEALPHATNDFGHTAYDGPDVNPGDPPHTYRFRLFALDVPTLGLERNATAEQVLEAARAHAIGLGEAELTAMYRPSAQ